MMLINPFMVARTGLLMHFDGDVLDSYGNYTIQTVSNNGIVSGSPVYSDTIKKFGSHAASVDMLAATQRYYRTNASYDFDFSGRKPFTLEGWFYVTGSWAGQPILFANNTGLNGSGNEARSTYSPFRLQANRLLVANAGLTAFESDITLTYTPSTLQHWAIVGDDTLIKVYRNGTQVASVNYPVWTTGTDSINERFLNIGAATLNGGIVGYVDEVRFLPSVVYSNNFTPPTSPF